VQTLFRLALAASLLAQPTLDSSETPTRALTVELTPRSPDVDMASVRVVVFADDAEATLNPTSRSGRQIHFDLPQDRSWRVTCESNDLWCPDLEVISDQTTRRRLPVAKRTLLRGTLQTASHDLPSLLNIQGWELRTDSVEALSFHLAVPLENGRFEVPAPDIPLDLRLAAEGFSPVYLWDLRSGTHGKAESQGTQDLGSVVLRPGNSLCGFVVDAASGHPLEAATVELSMPPPLVGSRSRSVARLRRMTWSTQTSSRGFFQLIGPPGGTYRLEVQSVDPEHHLLVVEEVGIVEDSETCLKDLEVQRAFEVGFTLDPSQAPGGEPWQVSLTPKDAGGFIEPIQAIAPDSTGWVGFRVSLGDYDLTVVAEGIDLTALRRSFRLDGPDEISLALSLVRVKGSIHLGEDPLVAQIHLMGRDGDRTTFESDGEGLFAGWLRDPEAQSLVAQIKAAFPPFSRWLELDLPPVEDGVLQLDLTFENRILTGGVESQDGTPVRRAQVFAVPVGSTMAIRSTTEVDGHFELVGLDDRPYLITAKAEGFGTSEVVRVEPWGEGLGPILSLVLHPGRQIQGQILSAEYAPVPAARLTLLVPGAFRRIEATSTDVNGNFDLRIPESARRAVVQIFAPSQMSWSACVEMPNQGENLVLHLPALPSGKSLLQLAVDPTAFATQTVLVTSEGGFLPLSSLANFGHVSELTSQTEGPSFKISSLAPGLYGVLQTTAGSLDLATQACSGALSATEWQHLLPGGEITLSVGPRE